MHIIILGLEESFKVGNHVLLKVKLKKSKARYCSPFDVLGNIGPIFYGLDLLPNIKVHNVFYVSLLKKHVNDPRDIVYSNMIQVNCRVDSFVLH